MEALNCRITLLSFQPKYAAPTQQHSCCTTAGVKSLTQICIHYSYAKKDGTQMSSHFSPSPTLPFLFILSFFFRYNYVQVMRQYNEGLLTKQERCKHFIIRQLEVSGRDVAEEEVNEMVATGKWEVFNENLLNDARITRSQLSEIEQRHKVRAVANLLQRFHTTAICQAINLERAFLFHTLLPLSIFFWGIVLIFSLKSKTWHIDSQRALGVNLWFVWKLQYIQHSTGYYGGVWKSSKHS